MARYLNGTTTHSRSLRNFQSAGRSATKLTSHVTDNAATGLLRWASTDHSNFSYALSHIPTMGFWDTMTHIFIHFVVSIVGAVLTAIWFYLLLFYGLPFFITGHF